MTNESGPSDSKSSESITPTSGTPLAASSPASRSASSRVPEELRTIVYAVRPSGHSVRPGLGVEAPSGEADGVGTGDGVAPPSSPGAGDCVALGTAEAAGDGVALTGTSSTPSASLESSTIASTTAISASASSTPTTATEARQPRGSAIRVPTAAPQFRHHSCSALSGASQRGQRRSTGVGGGGVSTLLTGGAPR